MPGNGTYYSADITLNNKLMFYDCDYLFLCCLCF